MPAQRDPRPRPDLRLVSDACYPSWDAVYAGNVTWVYRTIFARVGNRVFPAFVIFSDSSLLPIGGRG